MSDVTTPQAPQRAQSESPWWGVALLGSLLLLVILGVFMNKGGDAAQFDKWKTILGVIATLGIFSILYKENPIFRFVEHIYIGVAAGAGFVIIWLQFIYPRWIVSMSPKSLVPGGQGEWWLIIAGFIGVLLFTVYFPRLAWINRFLIGVLMGWAAGLVWREFLALLGPQLHKSFNKAPITLYQPANTPPGMNNIPLFDGAVWLHPFSLIFIIVLACVMAYFFFSIEHRAAWIRKPANAGRYFLMITLGTIFGTTVMGRFSLVIDRLDFLMRSFGVK